ncbi:MAG: polysaccharide biosynthesis tyrosine autokinase [Ruminococcus sp.]|nr:polysaccharide biosynthesis tyrosine autokinase [Ruminococcus sp.]
MDNSYSIKDIFILLKEKLLLIVLLTIAGAAAAFSYSKFVMPLKYSSHVTMYVQSYTGIVESSASSYNSISNSKQLVNTYMEVLKDDAVLTAVGEELAKQFDADVLKDCFGAANGKVSPGAIRGCLGIRSVQDTSAIKVTATTKNAKVSAAVCNDLALVAPEYVEKAVGVGSINTIDEAKVYNNPVAPNKTKNTILGAVAALFLTCLVIILIDFFDSTVKDTDYVAQHYKKPVLGEIQQFGERKKKESDEDDHVKLTDKDVPFNIVESYKSIRTNVSFSLSTVDRKIFAVSSPNPGEGKSTTSANIAIALAQGGNKVLLIDADMRKSTQHKVFGLKNKKGLSSAISKMKKVEECIQKNVMENLDVMTSGPIPPNPSELLASEQMGAILDKLSTEYSTIVIDTPPVNIVTDAMELAKYISGIVLVLRYGKTTTDDVEAANKKIEFAQMNMLGFIMNDVKTKHSGRYYKYKYKNKYYYKKGYGYGYGYGRKPESDDNDEQEAVAK